MTLLSFSLPPESGEKLHLGVTILLSMTVCVLNKMKILIFFLTKKGFFGTTKQNITSHVRFDINNCTVFWLRYGDGCCIGSDDCGCP